MSGFIISLIFSIGAAGWIYGKSMRRTGGLTQTSLISAGVAGLVLFILMLIATSFIPSN